MSCMAKRTRSKSFIGNPTKRLKVELQLLEEERTTTTILNLNDACLEAVFVYLNQNDLINVCETNPRFRYASEKAFTRNYGKRQIIVSMIKNTQINTAVLKSSLKLLQTFGHLITKLLIEFKLEEVEELLKSIDSNCSENVNELEFCHFGTSIRQRNLYKNGLNKINDFLDGLNERFPILHHLKFEYQDKSLKCPYFKNIARPITNLRSLAITGESISLVDIREFIDSNGQLECLTLTGQPNGNISQDFITYLDAALPQLKKLGIGSVMINGWYVKHPKRFENLKKLTLGSLNQFVYFDTKYLSFAGENIEEIEMFTTPLCLYTFAVNILTFKKLQRLVLHLIKLENDVTSLTVFKERLRYISDNNRLMEIVIQIYRQDRKVGNRNTVARDDEQYFDSIKNSFNTIRWNINENGNRLIISKVQNC